MSDEALEIACTRSNHTVAACSRLCYNAGQELLKKSNVYKEDIDDMQKAKRDPDGHDLRAMKLPAAIIENPRVDYKFEGNRSVLAS